jgi:hypothetical protein
MITINGTFTLCGEVHVAFTSTSAVQLTLSATAPHPTDLNGPAYKLVWLGDRAAQFHAEFEHALKIGTRMTVIATDPRPMIDRGDLCILANVLDIQRTPGRHVGQGTAPVALGQPARGGRMSRPAFKRYGVIKIVACSDPQLWYAGQIGQHVPNFGLTRSDGYRSREQAGFTNFVREADALPMTVLVRQAHLQDQWPYTNPMSLSDAAKSCNAPPAATVTHNRKRHKGQSHAHSWAEATVNIAVGFAISVVITALVLPAYGHHVTLSENLQITAIFTVASLLRSYALRRVFNHITTREPA